METKRQRTTKKSSEISLNVATDMHNVLVQKEGASRQ